MATCPNKNLESWKNLVVSRGEDIAYYLWDTFDGNVPESESKEEIVKSGLKATAILKSSKADQFFNSVVKNKISGDFFWKKMQVDLGIPKEQIEILKSFNTQDRGELISSLLANYSYAIEINTSKDLSKVIDWENNLNTTYIEFTLDGVTYTDSTYGYYYKRLPNVDKDVEISKEEYINARSKSSKSLEASSTQYYSNLTVPGGTNYTENEIATPAITPIIKGHAQFATNQGIGWFRSDDKVLPGEDYDELIWEEEVEQEPGIPFQRGKKTIQRVGNYEVTKTRRILEVQSDLFQKGRDKEDLVFGEIEEQPTFMADENQYEPDFYAEEYNYRVRAGEIKPNQEQIKSNQFLQLLNQGSNWVTFFVKSIIQDSAKKGYEKVLFPSGDTASKVEGHTTLEEFKKQKEARIKQLEDSNNTKTFYNEQGDVYDEPDFVKKERIENNNREIAQLKQELERVEGPEGFGALKPIYNFYENTVKNILNKQYGKENIKEVTDEYGNTWNEISIVPEREQQPILLQKKGTEGSKASPETIKILKDFLKRIGVSIKNVDEIVIDGIKQDANGAAILTQKLVQVVNGKEETALGEEAMHWAVELIQQKYPKLFMKLLKEVNNYNVYKQVLARYGTDANYQTKEGKPDIIKLKKEAIGKVLYETVVRENEGSVEKPELLQKTLSWWEEIINSLRELFGKAGFDEAAMKVLMGEELGTAEDVRRDEFYLQKTEATSQDKVNQFYNTFMSTSNRMRLDDSDPNDRHYLIDGRRITHSVTKWIKRNIAEKFVRTEKQKIIDDQKQHWGSEGHQYIENMLKHSHIDENGYRRTVPVPYTPSTSIDPDIRDILDGFVISLLDGYPEGTRFIVEKYVFNEKKDLASTIDFMAVIPKENDFAVDTLDWKFTTIDLERTEDIPGFKQEEWNKQMKEYAEILYRYGLKPSQLRKSMMVPFKANYEHMIPDDYNSPLMLDSIEIGNINNPKESNVYLLPVPLDTQSTGNKKLDKFIGALRDQYSKFVKRIVDPTQQHLKDAQREELAMAIRKLHLQLDFIPIAKIGNTFLKNARASIDIIKDYNLSSMSLQDMQNVVKELNYIANGAEKYSEVAEVYIYTNDGKILSEEEKNILSDLERLKTRTNSVLDDVLTLRRAYTVQLSVNYGITQENVEDSLRQLEEDGFIESGSILNPEREISGFDKLLTEGSAMGSRAINLMQRIWDIQKNKTDLAIANQIRAFEKVLLAAEQEAKSKGKSVFELVGKIKDGVPMYLEKLREGFISEMNEAKETRNKEFFLKNVDKAKYDATAKEIVDSTILSIDSNPNLDAEEKARRIDRVKNRLILERESFNGYGDSLFYKVFLNSIDYSKNLSSEYKSMSPAARDLWNFVVEGLNAKAKDLGYLGNTQDSFFALIDATLLQKFTDVQGIGGQFKDFFKDQFTVRVGEEQHFAKTDLETGKVIRSIPKYFTRTDRKTSQLSKDLTKVIPLWIKAVNEYELRSNMEDVFLTILAVEKNKNNILINQEQEIIRDSGMPNVTGENKNVNVFEEIMDYYLYDLQENDSSIMNKYIKIAMDKTGGLEEDKEARKVGVKKVAKTLSTWTQILGTGLKLAVGIPNWFGNQFQAYINSGNFYRFRKFQKNHGRILIPGLVKGKELGLLDLIIPLNEDVTTEERRKIARKQSLLKWLGTWTFQDMMMVTNSFPERRIQYANAMSFNESSMIIDGKIVQIRQYLAQQDRTVKYNMSEQERKALENSFEQRVEELENTKSLVQVAEEKDGYTVLPGVSEEELAKYRIKIRDFGRDISGQMSNEDKLGYTRDTMASAFMMFKGWIPKQISIRAKDIKFNVKQERWEYGRTRLFGKLILKYGLSSVRNAIDIMSGTDKGLALMQEIVEQKRDEYFKRTGEVLTITDEEFYDLMRKAVRDQFREIQVVLLTLGVFFAAKRFGDDDDEEDTLVKNRWKFLAKLSYKVAEEVNFYYNPLSVDGFTNGNLIPGMTIATRAAKIISSGSAEIYGNLSGDQDLLDKTHFGKAVLDIVPGPSQFQKEILPLVAPDAAKAWGIRVSSEVQRR